MNDISIINEHFVRMKKILWDESEHILARCFNFSIDIENGIIISDLKITSKRSLFEFIKLSFKSFSESPITESDRNEFYAGVQRIYERIYEETEPLVSSVLPYFKDLYQHQAETLILNYYKKHVFLAFDMGTGKSLTAASISRMHQKKRTLILCPNSVKYNWFRDMKKFGFNELYFTLLDASKYRTIRAFNERFVICNYDIVEKYLKELMASPIDHFILDEAHLLKNKSSNRTKAIHKLIEYFPDANVTMLSGTPVKNRVDDVFSYLKMIGHELGSNYKRFMDNYTIKSIGRFSKVTGGKNLQDLHVKLSNFIVRKTKQDCLDLPEKVYLSYIYQLDDYRSEYDQIIEQLSTQKEHAALSGNLHSLNIITARAKIKGIIEIAEGIIETGKKVVIFSGYKTPINELENYFRSRCVVVDGSINAFERDKNVQRFTNDETCEIFIGNIQAAGVGINLTVASDVIFTGFPFTPAELWQAIDRLHRIGQNNSVNVHYTICQDSIDEYIYDILLDKEKDIKALIDEGKDASTMDDNITEILISKLLKQDGKDNLPVDSGDDFLSINEATHQQAFEIRSADISPTISNGLTPPKMMADEIHGFIKNNSDIPDFLL